MCIHFLNHSLLDRVDDHTWFITLCFICRIIESLGTSGFITATTVFIAVEFPDNFATTFVRYNNF